jgi:hypothetical protein
MISAEYALSQLERIMGMVGFPKGPDSGSYVKEMRLAIQTAPSETIAERVISDILREFRRCPAAADIYTALRDEGQKLEPPPEYSEHHHCARCQDCGFYGGFLTGRYAGVWKWCDCEAAQRRRAVEARVVDEANVAREKLLRLMAPAQSGRNKPDDPLRPVQEIYHGDF